MKSCCLASLVLAALAVGLHAQQAQPSMASSYVGTSVGGSTHFDGVRTTQTVTLKFGPSDAPAFTVDYAFTYAGMTIARPAVVDEVFTRYLPDETQPAFAFSTGGDWTPLHVRQTSHSAATRSMPVADFEDFTTARAMRIRIYDSELVFSGGQLRMLRSQTVDRWNR